MRFFPFLCLSFLLILLSSVQIACAQESSIEDLLIPEPSFVEDIAGDTSDLDQMFTEESNIDELLGPKDVFPFLPDNHRDSGTGKFNSF